MLVINSLLWHELIGEAGAPWMCAISASKNAEESVRESSGLVTRRVPFNQFQKLFATHLKNNGTENVHCGHHEQAKLNGC